MKNKIIALLAIVLINIMGCACQTKTDGIVNKNPPGWASEAIWYQIFVERFSNGDTMNDPLAENIRTASDFFTVPANWHTTPWTQNWYLPDDWTSDLGKDFYSNLQLRRYGGDLQGVMDKLDYLSDLGINAVYFNPLNDAPSLHKYDARNYHHVDVNFGPDPEGDNAIIASEDPADPATWKWTSADKLFLEVVDSLHHRNIRVILDYSWNHTGVEFWAWKDIMSKGENSRYADWYNIVSFDKLETPENEFDYKGWLNIKALPEIKKVNTKEAHRNGFPFEGDLDAGAKAHILAVTKRWLAPDGDVTKGIDGYRLDVADHVPMGFWRDYRKFVKKINPDAYLVGEIWWQEWPDILMNPVPYISGDVFDGIMFYHLYRPARYFFANTDFSISAGQLTDSLKFQWNRIPVETRTAMMNTASTHDTPRLLSSFYNKGKYKFHAKPNEDENYKAGKPDHETYQRLRLYLMHQFTNIGAPHIWNGEEMGMWGSDDPDCRKPLWWPGMEFESENRLSVSGTDLSVDQVRFDSLIYSFYKKLIQIRKDNKVLAHGEIGFLNAVGKQWSYRRFDDREEIVVCFNLDTIPYTMALPSKAKYKELIDQQIISDSVVLQPLTGNILKRLNP
ncbi:MAG: alpha-amylase [Bacteroidales bacterium]|nr:alpha-amylase [Bacteroidales bacterium]